MSSVPSTSGAGQVPVEWHPSALVQVHDGAGPEAAAAERAEFALIVLNQPLAKHMALSKRLWQNANVCIAADGGANCLHEAAGQWGDKCFDNLHAIVGDLDSLDDNVRAYYEIRNTKIVLRPSQDATDFTKSVDYVRTEFHTGNSPSAPLDIVAIGGLGGRVDQGLSQIHHLYMFQKHPQYKDGRMYIFSGESLTFLLKSGTHHIRVRDCPGDNDVFDKHVGILPVREPSRITTKGLEWDVTDWETHFGGQVSTSNHVLPETEVVEVHTTKDVLFTIALRKI
ncbi:thiamine pyrophosphokinase [Podospora didyma]|uniref:Thiamine pyrophosphokinase n=1 Tax=Podospora didyma TaxID=330526 RepID=A0AAE0NXZ9_9PEZI|nr:thiamine pyrophosphokinase [Podospora didyma]